MIELLQFNSVQYVESRYYRNCKSTETDDDRNDKRRIVPDDDSNQLANIEITEANSPAVKRRVQN